MNFLKLKTTWTNLELIPLKICIASAYILVGAYFHSYIRTGYVFVLAVFAITVLYSMYLWVRKMRAEN